MSTLKTHVHKFLEWEKEKGDTVLLRQPYGDSWKEFTWKEVGNQARRMAAVLREKGIRDGKKVGIFSKNCYHWVIADLAISMAGGVSVPFYPNLTAAELNEVINKGEVEVLFVGKLDVWEPVKSGVPSSVKMIAFPHYEGNATVNDGEKWEELIAAHEPLKDIHLPASDELWTILFTSGTTGSPKGVMLTYSAPATIMDYEMKYKMIGIFDLPVHRFFSYLPLNHIAERIIVEGACLLTGGTISFAESLNTFQKNLESVQPTVFMAVPRIWHKFQLAILEKMPDSKLDFLLKLPIIGGIIKKKIKAKLGLSQAGIVLTGAAPTPDSLKAWFRKLGINLQEVYAMTENCGGCCFMPKGQDKPGTVGVAIKGVELRTEPETEEVVMRAPWLMAGYYNEPEKTAQVIRNGWLYTGDRGFIDEQGFLHLTGRVSDTFKTSKGKFIVPAPLEWHFAKNPHIEQICVAGLGAPQPLVLISLSEIGKAAAKEEVTKALEEQVSELNKTLPQYSIISKAVVIREEWSVDNGLLTPTLKIKRNAIDRRYSEKFNDWSESREAVIWV